MARIVPAAATLRTSVRKKLPKIRYQRRLSKGMSSSESALLTATQSSQDRGSRSQGNLTPAVPNRAQLGMVKTSTGRYSLTLEIKRCTLLVTRFTSLEVVLFKQRIVEGLEVSARRKSTIDLSRLSTQRMSQNCRQSFAVASGGVQPNKQTCHEFQNSASLQLDSDTTARCLE